MHKSRWIEHVVRMSKRMFVIYSLHSMDHAEQLFCHSMVVLYVCCVCVCFVSSKVKFQLREPIETPSSGQLCEFLSDSFKRMMWRIKTYFIHELWPWFKFISDKCIKMDAGIQMSWLAEFIVLHISCTTWPIFISITLLYKFTRFFSFSLGLQ